MKLIVPPRWVLGCLSIAPAVVSLSLDAWLRSLEMKGKLTGEPSMGVAPSAALLTLVFCVGGSFPLAIGLAVKGDEWEKLVAWVGLTMLNLVLAVPGCSVIYS